MRLIDADALAKEFEKAFLDYHPNTIADKLIRALRNAPTVDAVSVVRCKNCDYSEVDEYGRIIGNCDVFKDRYVNPDFFCANGEPKGCHEPPSDLKCDGCNVLYKYILKMYSTDPEQRKNYDLCCYTHKNNKKYFTYCPVWRKVRNGNFDGIGENVGQWEQLVGDPFPLYQCNICGKTEIARFMICSQCLTIMNGDISGWTRRKVPTTK